MRIRNNTSARFSLRESGKSTKVLKKNLEKLSSGYRINRAADDAAGLAISEKMRANITELTRCQTNVEEGIDLARTADSALAEINDMLNRAKGLCLQAANGTYDSNDRAEISKELNALFTEIDRITEGSCHNTVRLFRGEVEADEEEEELFHYERREVYTPVEDGSLAVWGELDFVKNGVFDPAPSAVPATAEFELDDSIDFNDKLSLNGKSMRIGDTLYYFTTNSYASPPTPSYSSTQKLERIMLAGYDAASSTEDALQEIARRTSGEQKITMEIDRDTRKVKLTAALSPLEWSISTREGVVEGYNETGSGTPNNGIIAQNPLGSASVGQIDSAGGSNNLQVYKKTATCTFSLLNPNAALTAGDINSLSYNTMSLPGVTLQLKNLNLTQGTTRADAGQKLADAIKASTSPYFDYDAAYDAGKLTITITDKRSGNTSLAGSYIYETKVTPPSKRVEDTANAWTSTPVSIQSNLDAGTGEKPATLEITVPSSFSAPFSFHMGTDTYVFYNSDNNKLTTPGYPNTSYSPSTSIRLVDLKNIGNPQAHILKLAEDYAKGAFGGRIDTISQNGDTLRIQAKQNAALNSFISGGSAITVTPYKYEAGTGMSTDYVFTSSYNSLRQESTISFNAGTDPAALVGKGFGLATSSYYSYKFQFTDGGPAESGYRAIDISGCADLDAVAATVETALKGQYFSSYSVKSVTMNGNQLEIGLLASGSSTMYITDGEEGIMKEGTVAFDGGTDAEHSYKELDFSSINRSNLDTLLGKGFRIHCATCTGEYINVFFCWTNDGSVPPVFEREDPSTGETRKIYNIPVELSKIKSGDGIVESIVEQVHPYMDHYTDVVVGDPPTTLLAIERRTGDVSVNGQLYLGRVSAGIETNFIYSVEDVKIIDEPDVVPVPKPKTHKVKIYAGSGSDNPYIEIHLPHIDPEWLDLYPGEVDLTVQDPLELMGRVDKANIAIADARGTIGADYNRLEHAFQDISEANIQLTEAESRIRDADIAELMMENVKLQILSQAQHSMMAQANGLPQYALQLLQ